MDTSIADTSRSGHCSTALLVHVVWSTRYRRRLLVPAVDMWLHGFLAGKARELGGELLAAGGGDDHRHVVVRYPTTLAVAVLVHRLNRETSVDGRERRRRCSEPRA